MADDVTKRMNFFDRQFLRASDFQIEQAYHIDRLKRHNQMLHTPGVAEGLEVRSDEDPTVVTVAEGTAIDALGQAIVLLEKKTIKLPAGAISVEIYILYDESPADPASDLGITGNTRIAEIPGFFMRRTISSQISTFAAGDSRKSIGQTQDPPPADGVLLAVATLDSSNGHLVGPPNNDVRVRAGAAVGRDLIVNSLTWASSVLSPDQGGSIELGDRLTARVPFIDFHHGGGPSEDYNVRIINNGDRQLTIAVPGFASPTLATPIGALSIDVTSFETGANSLASYFFRVRDIGAPSTPFYIRGDGNVGIGTPNPSEKLQIQAGSIFTNGESTGLIVDEGGKKRVGLIKYQSHEAGIWRLAAIKFEIGRVNAGVTALPGSPTSFTTDLLVAENGNVGIGTTGPNGRLHIVGGGETAGTLHLESSKGTHHSHVHWDLTGDWYIRSAADAGKVIIQDSGGNVGIGTDSPGAKLTIQQGPLSAGAAANGKALFVSAQMQDGSASDGGIEFRHENLTQGIGFGFNTIYATGSNPDQDLTVKARGTGRMFLNSNGGNVGIGKQTNIENVSSWNPVLTIGPSPLNGKAAVVELAGAATTNGAGVGALVFRNVPTGGGPNLDPGGAAGVLGARAVPDAAAALGGIGGIGDIGGIGGIGPPQSSRLGQIEVDLELPNSASMVFSTRSGGVFEERMRIGSNGVFVIKGLLTAPQINGTLTGRLVGPKVGYVVDQFVNKIGETLEQGDVLVIGENQTSFHYGEKADVPIPEVDIARAVYDKRVCGIVCELYGELKPEPEVEDLAGAKKSRSKKAKASKKPPVPVTVRPRVFTTEEMRALDTGRVQPDQIGLMVTLGSYAHCKVDADIAPIQVGDLLTTSPTKGHAQKVLDPGKAIGAIIGKALGSLKKGKGKIPVLVTHQ